MRVYTSICVYLVAAHLSRISTYKARVLSHFPAAQPSPSPLSHVSMAHNSKFFGSMTHFIGGGEQTILFLSPLYYFFTHFSFLCHAKYKSQNKKPWPVDIDMAMGNKRSHFLAWFKKKIVFFTAGDVEKGTKVGTGGFVLKSSKVKAAWDVLLCPSNGTNSHMGTWKGGKYKWLDGSLGFRFR